MEIIFIVLTCISAIFLGWAMGPAVELGAKKFGEMEWVKRHDDRVKAHDKMYSATSNPYFNPDKAQDRRTYFEVFCGSIFIVFLFAGMMTKTNLSMLYFKISGLSLLLLLAPLMIKIGWETIIHKIFK